MNPIEDALERKLLTLHTAFLGTVLSVTGELADVQPLTLYKQYGKEPQKQAVVTNVPILRHVKKMVLYEAQDSITVQPQTVGDHGSHTHDVTVVGHGGHVRLEPISAGDIVLCVCAERDSSQARKGAFALPAVGRHQMQDAIIVGVLS